ncbi:MAG: SET domain-containing protein-lysine N-methyltransferase [Ardenticatenales bacterium]|nr:SET domain-containing protein-lysine N-methyltransferase [Ardenticatenales bacterium]
MMVWGGDVYTDEQLRAMPPLEGNWSYSIIEEGLYLFGPADAMDYFINHSCDPNLWLTDAVTLVARRDIQPGDEIRGDYAIWESEPSYVLEPCQCGSRLCRARVTGNDWMIPKLQVRYEGHFLPFLSQRIAAGS